MPADLSPRTEAEWDRMATTLHRQRQRINTLRGMAVNHPAAHALQHCAPFVRAAAQAGLWGEAGTRSVLHELDAALGSLDQGYAAPDEAADEICDLQALMMTYSEALDQIQRLAQTAADAPPPEVTQSLLVGIYDLICDLPAIPQELKDNFDA